MTARPFQLMRNAFGKLVMRLENGDCHEGVLPVRAFPISDPHHGIALVSAEGHELAWIENEAALSEATRVLLQQELARREFMPEIRRICSVSSFATPSVWWVETERGGTRLTLKSEEDIRSLGDAALLIADSHGIHYLIRNSTELDAASRKLLGRFL